MGGIPLTLRWDRGAMSQGKSEKGETGKQTFYSRWRDAGKTLSEVVRVSHVAIPIGKYTRIYYDILGCYPEI